MYIRGLSTLAYANGYTVWHYKASRAETLADVMALGYFNEANDMIVNNDVIHITVMEGTAIRMVKECGRDLILVATL